MDIKQTKKLIDEGYNNLYVLTNIGWKDYRDEMLTSERKAVKKWRDQTRDIWGIDRKYLLTITEEAKFFCVQHVIEAMLSTRTLRLKEALHVKSSYALAHALMDGYPEKIIEAFDGFDVDKFLELSHTEFSTEKEVA
tara:strand:+ start:817 stop:1227 length:411 start_codon:yes stop_codon:yes gene_type:complete